MSAPVQVVEPRPLPDNKVDRRSGYVLGLLMLAAFALAFAQLVQVATGPPPPSAGSVAPPLAGPTPDGRQLALATGAYQNKLVLVDFWATWCPPCRAAMPTLEQVSKEYADRDFRVLGVNVESGEDDKVAMFMRQNRLSFQTLIDPGELSPSWGVHSYPTSFLIGADGKIIHVYRGPVPPARLRQDIEGALLPSAR